MTKSEQINRRQAKLHTALHRRWDSNVKCLIHELADKNMQVTTTTLFFKPVNMSASH